MGGNHRETTEGTPRSEEQEILQGGADVPERAAAPVHVRTHTRAEEEWEEGGTQIVAGQLKDQKQILENFKFR